MHVLLYVGYTILAMKTKNQRNSDCHRGWLIYCTSTSFLCLLTEAIVSLEHRLRGIEAAPQPEHRLRGEKCERVKKYAPQPRERCSLQHGALVEVQEHVDVDYHHCQCHGLVKTKFTKSNILLKKIADLFHLRGKAESCFAKQVVAFGGRYAIWPRQLFHPQGLKMAFLH